MAVIITFSHLSIIHTEAKAHICSAPYFKFENMHMKCRIIELIFVFHKGDS